MSVFFAKKEYQSFSQDMIGKSRQLSVLVIH